MLKSVMWIDKIPFTVLCHSAYAYFMTKSNMNTDKGKGPLLCHRHDAQCTTSQTNLWCLCHSLPYFFLFLPASILSSAITATALMHSPSILPYYNYGCIMEMMSYSENTTSQHNLRTHLRVYRVTHGRQKQDLEAVNNLTSRLIKHNIFFPLQRSNLYEFLKLAEEALVVYWNQERENEMAWIHFACFAIYPANTDLWLICILVSFHFRQ